MRGRDVLVAVGLVTAMVGLTAVFAPQVIGLSMTSITVTVLGVTMLVYALVIVDTDPTLVQASTGDPERVREMPRPGDELDMAMVQFDVANRGSIRARQRIRQRVVNAAVAVLAHTDRISESAARERIERDVYGERRELDVIANLDGDDGDETDASLRTRIARLARRQEVGSPLQRKIRRAVNAVGRRLDLSPIDPEEAYPPDLSEVYDRSDPPTRGGVSPQERGFTEVFDGVYRRSHRETDHWAGVVALVFGFAGLGVLTRQPPLLLAGVAGIAFAAYSRRVTRANPTVSIERELEPEEPIQGAETTVRLTVTNEGSWPLPDVRVVDGVPARLEVVSGVPRLGTALRPGEAVTLTYEVRARRGAHEFAPALVLSRDASGAIEEELLVVEDTVLTCTPSLQAVEAPVPLREVPTGFVGRAAPQRGGGVEFHSVRPYRPGDPLNRIDWNRHARTGELATLEFREERSTTVVLLIDTRREAYLAPGDGDHAVERAVEAASGLFAALHETSNRVGIASLGPDACWLAPRVGHHHARMAERLLGSHRAFSSLPPSEQQPSLVWLRDLRGRLPEESQVIFLSPLCDDFGAFVARRLDALGYPVTVLSPDPTGGRTLGARFAEIQRTLRVIDLMQSDVPVIDWEWDLPLDAALRREASRRGP